MKIPGRRSKRNAMLAAGVSVVLISAVALTDFAPTAAANEAMSAGRNVSLAHFAAGAVRSTPQILHSRTVAVRHTTTIVPCLFNGRSNQDPVANVIPGNSISISCTGFLPSETVVATEGSPLFAKSDSESDLDPNTQFFTTNSSGALDAKFVVPDPFVASDPKAVCPPTATQVADGFLRCFVVLADESGNGSIVALNYSPGGYWMVGSDGGVFAFGNAGFVGSLPGYTSMSTTSLPSCRRYDEQGLLDGRGRRRGVRIRRRRLRGLSARDRVHVNDIVAVVPTQTARATGWSEPTAGCSHSATPDSSVLSREYRSHVKDIVASCRRTTARATGWLEPTAACSASATPASSALSREYTSTSMTSCCRADHDSKGYWMVGSDGGVFGFGDAGFVGSLPEYTSTSATLSPWYRRLTVGVIGWLVPTAECSASVTPVTSDRSRDSASTSSTLLQWCRHEEVVASPVSTNLMR